MKPKRRNLLPWLKSRLRRLQVISTPTGRQMDRMDDLIYQIRQLEPKPMPRVRRSAPMMSLRDACHFYGESDPYRAQVLAMGGHLGI